MERLALRGIERSLANLRTFPCVRILEERGKLRLHAAYFDVSSGVLSVRDEDTGHFRPAVAGSRRDLGGSSAMMPCALMCNLELFNFCLACI